MENGVNYVSRTYCTHNTKVLEKARELQQYDFRGEVFVNFGKGTVTFLTDEAERALSELTGDRDGRIQIK